VPMHDEPGTQRRLHILDDEEVAALYGRPCFSVDDRADHFTLEPAELALLRSLRGVSSQVAFLLQLGYFKAKQLFFPVPFDEVAEDVAYLLARYCVLSVSWGMPPPQSRQLGGAGLGGSGRLVRNQGGETR